MGDDVLITEPTIQCDADTSVIGSYTVTGNISLYAKWLKKENVSVGGEETVIPDVVVDDTTAIIKHTEEEIDQIVENSRDDETIVIDLSGLDDTVSKV